MTKPIDPFEKVYVEALYRDIKWGGYHLISFYVDEDTKYHEGYVRVSEPVEIRVNRLQDEAVIHNAIAMLDEAERKARMELEQKLAEFREQRKSLLALTHQTEEAA